jgi:hypothetical protein
VSYFDGAAFLASHCFSISAASRQGIVKVSMSYTPYRHNLSILHVNY